MKNHKVSFKNDEGDALSAKLSLPANQNPHNYVVFAHCFTCTKNLKAIHNISKSLTGLGFGVLSFDFTGLGESEGEFADSNFSSNVNDLLAAVKFLEKDFQSPTLIIGHSLGGAAAILAASKIDSIKAIVTIGTPADTEHVLKLMKENLETIMEAGEAHVDIGGQQFTIKKQFIEDVRDQSLTETLSKLRKSILIMHSPQDRIVGIQNSAELYKSAHHPKSFISLDGADHLLSNKEDSLYVGHVIAAWAQRYLEKPMSDKEKLDTEHQTIARLGDKEQKFTVQIKTGNHYLVADEPTDVGGLDWGPSPYQLVSAALGACTAMTLRMYADRKKWKLDEVSVHLNHRKRHQEDCLKCESQNSKIDHIERIIEVSGDLDEQQKQRLLEIANKCPVHRTLEDKVWIESEMK
jgi:uncharacterized OsmC-like protein/alpha-beta hydrolase superfamily lysophospholipase